MRSMIGLSSGDTARSANSPATASLIAAARASNSASIDGPDVGSLGDRCSLTAYRLRPYAQPPTATAARRPLGRAGATGAPWSAVWRPESSSLATAVDIGGVEHQQRPE